jgi:alkylated DNA repair protein (DNA oxidative demethylase)
MSVRMTSAGRYGWYTDRSGYRYIDRHPDGIPWPPIPESILSVWRALVSGERMPDCCLVNRYGPKARMGMHRDADEKDFSWPVLSISLGDSALFRMGGRERSDPTTSILLDSGDVVVFGGEARLAYHGIDRIRAGSSSLLPGGGRINLTCRVVDR